MTTLPKEYVIRIESPEQGFLLHLLFDAKDFEKTKLWLGTVEMQTKEGKKEVNYIESKYINLMDLLMFMNMVEEK